MKIKTIINIDNRLIRPALLHSKKLSSCKRKNTGSFSAYVEQAVYERLILDGVDVDEILSKDNRR